MNTTCKIAIVEDEEVYSLQLKNCLEQYEEKNNLHLRISRFYDAKSFFAAYETAEFDLVFLDIRLPDGNGMNIAKRIRLHDEKTMLIFVTNLANYAIKGYEVAAFDFILKPVNYESFAMKFKRAYAILDRNNEEVIKVKTGNDIKVIPIFRITYIEVSDHVICIHTTEGEVNTTGRITDFLDRLEHYGFAMCNQCYLVHLRYVAGVKDDTVFIGEEALHISRPRKKEFLKALNDYLGA